MSFQDIGSAYQRASSRRDIALLDQAKAQAPQISAIGRRPHNDALSESRQPQSAGCEHGGNDLSNTDNESFKGRRGIDKRLENEEIYDYSSLSEDIFRYQVRTKEKRRRIPIPCSGIKPNLILHSFVITDIA